MFILRILMTVLWLSIPQVSVSQSDSEAHACCQSEEDDGSVEDNCCMMANCINCANCFAMASQETVEWAEQLEIYVQNQFGQPLMSLVNYVHEVFRPPETNPYLA